MTLFRRPKATSEVDFTIQNTQNVYKELVYYFKKRKIFRNSWDLKCVRVVSGTVIICDKEDDRRDLQAITLAGYTSLEDFQDKNKFAVRILSQNPKLEKECFAVINEENRMKLKDALMEGMKIANDFLYSDIKTLRKSKSKSKSLNASHLNSTMPTDNTASYYSTINDTSMFDNDASGFSTTSENRMVVSESGVYNS